jgi:Flp pilus assembly protein TadD
MSGHQVSLTSLAPAGDLKNLKAIVLTVAGILKIDKREAVDKVKKLPLILAINLSSGAASLMADSLSSLGAGVKVTPPLDVPVASPLPSPWEGEKPPKKGLRFTWQFVLILAVFLAAASFMAVKMSEWVLASVNPTPETSMKQLKKGDMKAARKSLGKQEKQNPNDVEVLTALGMYYIGQARTQMSKEHWEAYQNQKMRVPEVDSALAVLKRAESLAPKNGQVMRWQSAAWQVKGDLRQAEIAARRAVELTPNDPDLWNQLGSVLVDEQKYTDAERAFYTSLKLDNNAAAVKNLAIIALYYQKDATRAAQYIFNYFSRPESEKDFDAYKLRIDLTSALALDFNPPWSSSLPPPLPFSDYEQRRKELAAQKSLKKDAFAQEALGMLYLSSPGMAEADEAAFTQAVQINPKLQPSWKMLVLLQLSSERYDNAYISLQKAIDAGADDPFFYRNLGFLERYYKLNQAAARTAWNKYLSLGGDRFAGTVRKSM